MFPRLIKLFTNPKEYWNEAVGEPGDIKSLLIPQMAIVAAIPAVAYFLGFFLGFLKFSVVSAVIGGVISLALYYVFNVGLWIGFGFIINALATPFGAQADIGQSMKLATGAMIPMWGGAALYLTTISALGMVGQLAGLGYGAYVLYLGLPVMNGTAQEKAVGYTAASIGILFVLAMVGMLLVGCPAGCLITASITRVTAF